MILFKINYSPFKIPNKFRNFQSDSYDFLNDIFLFDVDKSEEEKKLFFFKKYKKRIKTSDSEDSKESENALTVKEVQFHIVFQGVEKVNLTKLKMLEKALTQTVRELECQIDTVPDLDDVLKKAKKDLEKVLAWSKYLGKSDYYIKEDFIFKSSEFGTKTKNFGRIYSRFPSLLYFPKKFRHFLLKEDYLDFDLRNSHISILINESVKNGWGCDKINQISNDLIYREKFKEDFNINESALKTALLFLLNGCSPKTTIYVASLSCDLRTHKEVIFHRTVLSIGFSV
jgi:hypothetical protein